jgi:hypothetical protein
MVAVFMNLQRSIKEESEPGVYMATEAFVANAELLSCDVE